MEKKIKILHLEDLRSDAELVDRELKKAHLKFERLWVTNKDDFIKALVDYDADVILSDHNLPAFSSVQAFEMVKAAKITVPFILVTSTISEEFAVSRIKEGVTDYLLKDRLERLPSAVVNAIERYEAEQEKQRYLNRVIENEKLLRKTEELAHIGSWRRDLATGKAHWSDEAYLIFGYKPQEISPSFDLTSIHVHPQDRALFKKVNDDAMRTPGISKVTFRIIDKQENIKWIYCEIVAEFDENGQPVVLRGFNQDITERKHAEEALKKSEEFNKGVLASLISQIAVIDYTGNIIAVNKAWEDFAFENDLTSLERVGVNSNYFDVCRKAIAEGDRLAAEALEGIFSVLNKERTSFTLRYPCHSPDTERWFLLRVMEFDGDKPKIVTVHENITEIVLAEQKIKQSEANLAAIIENTDASIYSIDKSYRYVTFNTILKDTLLEFYGLSIKPGDHAFHFMKDAAPEEFRNWQEIYESAFRGNTATFEKDYSTAEQPDFVHFSINPIWEQNEVIALSCFARNITRQKLAEAEIKSLNESLEKKVKERTAELSAANKELEAFSYTVAHDLRAPLRITDGFVGLLLKDHTASLNEEGKYLLSIISQNATQMSQLVGDLLELSRVGRITISQTSCNMHEIAEQACAVVKAADSNFRAEISIHPLPDIKCDAHLIKQVWLNLISNAVKYSSKAENPKIEIGSSPEKHTTIYYIKDNGAGFDMELSAKLFRPFQRLHKRSDYEGTGVGLALSQLIVSKHGGEMWATGKVGEGATFYFSLPN